MKAATGLASFSGHTFFVRMSGAETFCANSMFIKSLPLVECISISDVCTICCNMVMCNTILAAPCAEVLRLIL